MWQATVKMAENIKEEKEQHRLKRYQDREIRRAQRKAEQELNQDKTQINNIGLGRSTYLQNDADEVEEEDQED